MSCTQNIYYDPANRNHNLNFKFLALYDNKRIKAVGELKKTVYCDYVDGKLVSSNDEKLNLAEDEYETIKETIKITDYYDLRQGSKFMLVDKFHETDFEKESHSSLRGKRYFHLSEIEGYQDAMNSSEIANLLRGKKWK